MFDFGFWELVLIMVVALLVVGPERLPGLARQAGLWIGKARRFVNNVRSDIEREIRSEELKTMLNHQQSEIQELKGMLAKTQTEVKSELEQTDHLVKSLEDPLETEPNSVTPSELKSTAESLPKASDNGSKQSSGN
jgi:sec-independent protein translocase protein TatB